MTDRRREGAQAQQELVQTEAAFAAVRQAMVERLLNSAVADTAAREKLYLAVQSLDAVRKVLFDVIAGAQIEEAVAGMEA
jgi:hypothetical protein